MWYDEGMNTTRIVITARKIVAHTSYAVSGNAHNPTVRYNWIGQVNGVDVTNAYRTRREALEVAAEVIAETN